MQGGRAVAVDYMVGREPRRATASGEILLCTGAVQSPQLLQLSGIGDPAHLRGVGIKTVHELPGVGRNLQDREAKTFGFEADFQVESYLRYQGRGFTQRFDANSYLYITRAMDYFDLAEEHGGKLADAFAGTDARFCLVSFDSDWLYPTSESRHVVHALNAAGAAVSFVELSAPHGHDSFLLDVPALDRVIGGFLG